MKLELGKIRIDDIQFGEEICVKNHTLFVNKQEIIDLVLEDDKIKDCKIELAKPGESTRITPVKDVIEPRDHTLFVNKQEIIDLVLEDDKIKDCKIELAKPGESTRITPVKDVIEPRVKVSGGGEIYKNNSCKRRYRT